MALIPDRPEMVQLPPTGGTRLVRKPDDREVLTNRRDTDARTALLRGLKEYLEQLTIAVDGALGTGGREVRFVKVLQTWAEPEIPANFPSALVYSAEAGTYDGDAFSPQTFNLASGLTVRQVAEYVLPITIEIWANDPVMRMALAGMVESGLNPVDWMSGLRLELPHYHGARATYELINLAYADTSDDAQHRYRRAIFLVQGSVSQIVSLDRTEPNLTIKMGVEVEQGGDSG